MRSDELERLKDIRLRALSDAPYAFGSRYENEAARDALSWLKWLTEGTAFVVEDDRGWHGLAAMYLEPNEPSVAHLSSMWVDPSERRKGVAGTLIAAGIAWAYRMDATSVRLGVAEGNDAAVRLYTRLGFVATGETEPLHSDLTRCIRYMALPLAGSER